MDSNTDRMAAMTMTTTPRPPNCEHCRHVEDDRHKLSPCPTCRSVSYCSIQCLVAGRAAHEPHCVPAARLSAAAAANSSVSTTASSVTSPSHPSSFSSTFSTSYASHSASSIPSVGSLGPPVAGSAPVDSAFVASLVASRSADWLSTPPLGDWIRKHEATGALERWAAAAAELYERASRRPHTVEDTLLVVLRGDGAIERSDVNTRPDARARIREAADKGGVEHVYAMMDDQQLGTGLMLLSCERARPTPAARRLASAGSASSAASASASASAAGSIGADPRPSSTYASMIAFTNWWRQHPAAFADFRRTVYEHRTGTGTGNGNSTARRTNALWVIETNGMAIAFDVARTTMMLDGLGLDADTRRRVRESVLEEANRTEAQVDIIIRVQDPTVENTGIRSYYLQIDVAHLGHN